MSAPVNVHELKYNTNDIGIGQTVVCELKRWYRECILVGHSNEPRIGLLIGLIVVKT